MKNYFCEIFNLGNNKCENLLDMIGIIENCLNSKANLDLMKIQPGDVKKTFADIEYSKLKLGYTPKISIKKGIPYIVFISPLICTLFAGPFGLLLFLVLRFFYKRFTLKDV